VPRATPVGCRIEVGPSLHIALQRTDDSCTITVSGEVDMATSTQLKRALDGVLATDPLPVLIRAELVGVEFLDTTGLGLLLTARTQAEQAGSRFVVASTSPALDRLFAITGVTEILCER
jgi:anti-sigma B factor antagonist